MNRTIKECKGLWTLAVLAGIGFVLTAAGVTLASDQPDPKADVIRLVVDYGDGVEKHFTALPWKDGMTVLDALSAASAHPHGIRVEYKDYGADAGFLILKIDDLANQGGGKDARNWIYRVNGTPAKTACNKQELAAGDEVRWTFQVFNL